MEAQHILLPTGLWIDGTCHRQAVLRPPTGHDEEYAAALTDLPLTAQATHLLSRCLARLGDYAPVEPAVVAALPVGDREALLLHLRRMLSGEDLGSTVACQEDTCKADLDLELTVSHLLQPPYEDHAPYFHLDRPASRRIRLRLPTGSDQEAVAGLAATDPAAAGRALTRRCILTILKDGIDQTTTDCTDEDLDAISKALRERDPQAETVLDIACPDCGTSSTLQFDAGAFLLQEVRDRHKDLLWEIHHLALHYHWDEQSLLAMTSTRRRTYLAMLEATVGET